MTSPDVTDEPVGGAEETIPEDRLPAYFWRDEQGRFVPNEVAAGLWAPNTISGRMVGGLFGHALVEEHGVPGYRLSRLNVDLFRSIPYAPLTVTTESDYDSAKGGELLIARGKPTPLVSTHGCDGCSTSVGVKGFGKSKTQTVTHGCTKQMLASVSCCK